MAEVPEHRNNTELVVIHDEDDGSTFQVAGAPETAVRTVVDQIYQDHLHRERRAGDRLVCDASGGDVFGHLDERLEHYERTQCKDLVWRFSGDQGGAGA